MNEAYLDISKDDNSRIGGGSFNISDDWPRVVRDENSWIHGAGGGISPDWDV